MGISRWKSAAVWAGIVISLLARVQFVSAADSETPSDSVAAQDEKTRELARLVWSIIDVVERQHISPPSRDKMLLGIATAFGKKQGTKRGNSSIVEFRACRTFDDFRSLFLREWNDSNWTHTDSDKFLDLVIQQISSDSPSPIRLEKAKEYAVQEQFRNNRYVGLGVALGMPSAQKRPTFHTIFSGGAAERARLESGVEILNVDGRSTLGVDTDGLLDWLRGSNGTQVTLKVAGPGNQPERELTLTRGVVRIDSVFGLNQTSVSESEFRFEPNEAIGCLVVNSVVGSTLHELRDAEVRVCAAGIRALILDFQSNIHSDNFHQAKLLADGLMDGGTIWSWQERNAEPRPEIADRECLFRGMPLVILVSKHTGAAHAALAAALQDSGRAVIVGETPDFHGMVSSGILLLDERHVLIMDTAKLIRSRSGRVWPLEPDYVVNQEQPQPPRVAMIRSRAGNGRVTIPLNSAGNIMDVPIVPRTVNGRDIPTQGRSGSAGISANQSDRPNASLSWRSMLAGAFESFYNRSGIDHGQSAVSALIPANLSDVEIIVQLHAMRLRNLPVPFNLSIPRDTTQPFVEQAQQGRKAAITLARKIAAELLNVPLK